MGKEQQLWASQGWVYPSRSTARALKGGGLGSLSDLFARPLQPKLWELGLLWAVPQSGIEFLLGILCWCCEIRAWLFSGISSGDRTGQGSIQGVEQPGSLLVANPGACGQLPFGQGAPSLELLGGDLSTQE